MSFADPTYLLALLLVPLGALAVWSADRRRRKFAVRFPAVGALLAAAPARPAWQRWIPSALALAGIAALALAIAKPQRSVAVPVEQASVLLVTDTSGSMAAVDVEPTRLHAAQEAARDFVDEVPDTLKVGMLSYSQAVSLRSVPTEDRELVRAAIDALAADGGTATGEALDVAVRTLRPRGRSGPPSAIVLLSDGKTTAGRDPIEPARMAKRLRVPIFTVALGTADGYVVGPGGGLIPVPPDVETLREIAKQSGGRAFTADDADDLGSVYRRLGSQLGTKKVKKEITAGFAAGGLLFLGAGMIAALRRRPVLA